MENKNTYLATLDKTTQAVQKVFDVRKVESVTDFELFVERQNTIGDTLSLATCRVFYDIKRKKLWESDNRQTLNKFKTFESWAEFVFVDKGLKRASIANYVYVGQFVDESGFKDRLPKSQGYDEKSYSYSALLLILRLCGKGLKGKRDDINRERAARAFELSEKGYINPDMTNIKQLEKSIEKGLKELYGVVVDGKTEIDENGNESATETATETATENKPLLYALQFTVGQLTQIASSLANIERNESLQLLFDMVQATLQDLQD